MPSFYPACGKADGGVARDGAEQLVFVMVYAGAGLAGNGLKNSNATKRSISETMARMRDGR